MEREGPLLLSPIPKATRREVLELNELRFLLRPRPALWGVLSMLVVSGVAVYLFLGPDLNLTLFCTGGLIRGANIEIALGVGFLGGLAGVVAIAVAARVSGYLLSAVLFLGAAMVAVALALVAADSATFIQDESDCGFFSGGEGTATAHVGYLYALWGVPLVVLLCATVWALRNARSFEAKPFDSKQTGLAEGFAQQAHDSAQLGPRALRCTPDLHGRRAPCGLSPGT